MVQQWLLGRESGLEGLPRQLWKWWCVFVWVRVWVVVLLLVVVVVVLGSQSRADGGMLVKFRRQCLSSLILKLLLAVVAPAVRRATCGLQRIS